MTFRLVKFFLLDFFLGFEVFSFVFGGSEGGVGVGDRVYRFLSLLFWFGFLSVFFIYRKRFDGRGEAVGFCFVMGVFEGSCFV